MTDPKKDFFALTLRELQAFAAEDNAVILVTPGATLITRHSFLLSVGHTVCKVAIGKNDIEEKTADGEASL
jgi:hypothetical protein